MKYMGSKRRIAKEIGTYINNSAKALGITDYYEPFCGGASVAQVVNVKNRHCSDINKYVIALLKFIRDGGFDTYIPKVITEEEWRDVKASQGTDKYPDWYTCYVGIYCSYRGRWFQARFKEHVDKTSGCIRNNLDSYKNMISEKAGLQGIELSNKNYWEIGDIKNSIIYCDAPYINTKGYVCGKFDFERYYKWLKEMAKDNVVFISEYFMPANDFELIAEYQLNSGIGSGNTEEDYTPVERLYIVKGGYGTELLRDEADDNLDDLF